MGTEAIAEARGAGADPRAGITRGTASDAGNAGVIAAMPGPVAAFYRGFLTGDVPAIVALLHPDVRIRFPSYPVLRGVPAARHYFEFQENAFGELAFQLVETFTEGAVTYVVWREDGVLASGAPWRCHGVDTIECRGGAIARVDVGGSAWPLLEILPRYSPEARAPEATS